MAVACRHHSGDDGWSLGRGLLPAVDWQRRDWRARFKNHCNAGARSARCRRVGIHFRQPAGFSTEMLETFPSENEKELLGVLAADLTAEAGSNEIVLELPKTME